VRSLLLLLAAAAGLSAQPRHVVLISIDGYPAYALRDPQTPAPTLRRMIREGAWAEDGMTNINPTVTWPNHTSMVTGVDASKHGVLYNGLPVRSGNGIKIEPWRPKPELVLAPTVYDLAHAARMTTAEVDWVAIHQAPTITWSFAERPAADSAVAREMIAAGLVTAEDISKFADAPITHRDEIWVQAAVHILKSHKPNLLLFHSLTTDSSQHRYGARSLGATAALALADRYVERLVDAARSAGILNRTTFIVTSDHGFLTAKRQIRPAALLKREDVIVISEGGTAMIYGKVDPSVFKGVEGVDDIITPDRFASLGYPPPGGRMADLVLSAAEGYAFSAVANGPAVVDMPANANPGNHGYLASKTDSRPIFVAWGAGVKPGARVTGVRTVDIAPTVARLLGLEMKNVDGRVIAGALR
jgi:predicted AlkP superfamily pyrophosphatase or phosphodiesterase